MVLTVGLPLVACVLFQTGFASLAALVPAGAVYLRTATQASMALLPGPLLWGVVTLALGWQTQRHCVEDLRQWYDRHHGQKGME